MAMPKDLREVYDAVENDMFDVWSQIAPDAMEMCEGDNAVAVEMILDANRLSMFCGVTGATSEALLSEMYTKYGFGQVCQYFALEVSLL